jgi:peptidoglycan/LPS O-acetylase OafA/YrhL
MDYRREIDGLRALALLPVIFFHAGFELFSGGFVGVDVFFVISGYLITTVILIDLEKGKFSIIHFYERRARRILPALFIVIFVCIPFAWLWLLPADMKKFSQSLVAVVLFVSNIFFARESGYFDTEAEFKPLLHTWSLAVEEQFYIFFPILLILFWTLNKKLLIFLLGLIFIVSFSLAQYSLNLKSNTAFYFLTTRGWELLIGVFIAFYLFKFKRNNFSKYFSEAGGWFGVLLIIYAIFTYSKITPFPSFYALVPTLGTGLIILFATQKTVIGQVLGNKIFVNVGLISYSAYLWHQPLFAFVRHRTQTEPGHIVFFALIFLTFLFAYISWKFVELPFRKKEKIIRGKIFIFSFICITFFVAIGYLGYSKNGFEGRFKRILTGDIGQLEFHKYIDTKYFDCEPKSVAETAPYWKKFLRCKQSKKGTPDIILLGDSYSEHLFLGLAEYFPKKNVAFYIQAGKPYIENLQFKSIFDELLSNEKPQHIIMTMYYGSVDSDNELYYGFSSTIKALLKSGKLVTLVGNIPFFKTDPANCVYLVEYKKNPSPSCVLNINDVEQQKIKYDNVLLRLSQEFRLPYIRIDKLLCSKNNEEKTCEMFRDNSILYRDRIHLNIIGSKIVGNFLSQRLIP